MINFIAAVLEVYKKKKFERIDLEERKTIADSFNNRYTYRLEYVKGMPELSGTHMHFPPRGGFAWMCPSCNKIHRPYENSVFSGLQYPACCKYFAGHRLFEKIKIR